MSKLTIIFLMVVSFAIGSHVEEVIDGNSYTRGFLASFRNTPKQCRQEVLKSYAREIFSGQ